MTIVPTEFDRLFGSLNESQQKALKATNDSVLQIVAGPGTGKTKLLVSRVAYLILNFDLLPSSIIVTTFTKKASIEMKDRLNSLLKDHENINFKKIQIGTFHSICFGYLKFYGKCIGLENFNIADTKDQKDMLKMVLQKLNMENIQPDKFGMRTCLSYITKNKSIGSHPEDVVILDPTDVKELQCFQAYQAYQETLAKNGKIDFDDILVFTYKLLIQRPSCVANIRHILVDEFQDTNIIQLKLIFLFSQYCNDNITIVGDADQSIYGFRNASYENFSKIKTTALQKNRNFMQITLEQSYRSTAAILQISEALMRHQTGRTDKLLISNSDKQIPVYYIDHEYPEDEPIFIASKIDELLKDTNNGYLLKDFAIIARASRIFLSLEKELLKRGIRYRITKGHSFWELKEVSMAMDCLQIIANDDWLSYKRVMEWFVDGCGEKLISKIENIVLNNNSNEIPYGYVYDILTKFATGMIPGMGAKAKASTIHFLTLIKDSRELLKINDPVDFFFSVVIKFNLIDFAMKKKTSRSKDDDEKRDDIRNNLHELADQFNSYNPADDDLLRKTQAEIFAEQEKNSADNTLFNIDNNQSANEPSIKSSSTFEDITHSQTSRVSPKDLLNKQAQKSPKKRQRNKKASVGEKPQTSIIDLFKMERKEGSSLKIKKEPVDDIVNKNIEPNNNEKEQPVEQCTEEIGQYTEHITKPDIDVTIEPTEVESITTSTTPLVVLPAITLQPTNQSNPTPLGICAEKEKFLRDFLQFIQLAESIAATDENHVNDPNGRVTLTTIHGSKGLEWSVVLLPSLINGIIPSVYSLAEQSIEKKELLLDEERRCFYVALTRAKDLLYLSTYHVSRSDYSIKPSCFLKEIPQSCYKNLNESTSNQLQGYELDQLSIPSAAPFHAKEPFQAPRVPNISASSTQNTIVKTEVIGSSGDSYNPVTGAISNEPSNNLPPKKKKRLGMGRPKNNSKLIL